MTAKTKAKAKVSSRRELPAAREIDMPPRDYQPSKAEREEECDMPGADLETVRRAFFRPVRAARDQPQVEPRRWSICGLRWLAAFLARTCFFAC